MSNLTKDDVFTTEELVDIQTVKERIEQFIKSVKLPVVLIKPLKNSILTGGASASLFHGDTPKDWDFYLTNQADIDEINKVIKETEVLQAIQDINPKYGVDTIVEGKLVTPRAITFKNGVQIITMSRADARDTFDFIHCMPYYDIQTKTYHISRRQFVSIKSKTLMHNPKSPQPATYRRQKFLNRGWRDSV
jgi:hypothetical protein